jgi:hypothetical protein
MKNVYFDLLKIIFSFSLVAILASSFFNINVITLVVIALCFVDLFLLLAIIKIMDRLNKAPVTGHTQITRVYSVKKVEIENRVDIGIEDGYWVTVVKDAASGEIISINHTRTSINAEALGVDACIKQEQEYNSTFSKK